MTPRQFRPYLRVQVQRLGSVAAAAQAWGVTARVIRCALAGDSHPPKALLTALGLRQEVRYVPLEVPGQQETCKLCPAVNWREFE